MSNKFSSMLKGLSEGIKKHSPELLTGIGIAGMVTTTVLAVRATPKALILIEEKQRKENEDELKPVDVVKTTWKCYVPSVVTGALSITCLICAGKVSARQRAALATAYSLSESALKEYQDKVVETIGEKKERSIRDAIAKDKIEKDPPANKEIIITGKGETLCYDAISGRYFKSDIEKLRRIENEMNKMMIDEMYIPLNDFYYAVGLKETKLGDDLGWNLQDGLINMDFSSQLAENETPCLVIDYQIAPKYDYQKLY